MRQLRDVFTREIRRLISRPSRLGLLVGVPAVLFFLLGYLYSHEVVRDLPVGVVDLDRSNFSRTVIRGFEATPAFKIDGYFGDVARVRNAFQRGRLQRAIVIPYNAEKLMKEGKPVIISIYSNASNVLVSNLMLRVGTAVVRTLSAGVTIGKLRARGMTVEAATALANPIQINSHALYNPAYSYERYLLPGLLPMILQIVIMLGGAILINTEWSENTWEGLLGCAGKNPWTILAGKALPYLLLHTATGAVLLGIVFPYFNITIAGSSLKAFLWLLLFISACLMTGMLLSVLFRDPLMASEVGVFLNTPASIFSGYTFPLWAMPLLHQTFSKVLPFTYFLNGFLKLYQMGAGGNLLRADALALILFTLIPLGLSALILQVRINQSAVRA